jgi:hypothetical protein
MKKDAFEEDIKKVLEENKEALNKEDEMLAINKIMRAVRKKKKSKKSAIPEIHPNN